MASEIKVDTVSEKTSANGVSIDSVKLKDGTVDVNGASDGLILDADADTTISADTDDQIDIKIAGADDFKFTANTFTANSGSSIVVPDGGLTFGSTAIASTAAELNILDGVTSTAAELNILDGVTATASELNLLDGGTSVGSSITLADADGFVVNDGGTMKTIPASDISAYAGGNFVKLGTVTTNNSNVSALTIDNCFTTTYDLYRIVGFHNQTSGGSHQYFRWRTGGSSGSSYTTSNYTWINRGHYLLDDNSAGEYINKNASSDHGRVASDVRADSNSAFTSFDLLVADPLTTIMSRSQVTGTSTTRQNTNARFVAHYVGITNQANVDATGFEMTVSTGNISYGRVTVYGLVHA